MAFLRSSGSCLLVNDALVNLVDLVVKRGLLRGVLAVQSDDEVVRRLLAVVVGVVAVTEKELAAGGGVSSDAPAARLVAVVFLEELIRGGRDRAKHAELGDVRPEPRPERVVRARLVDRAG